MSKEILYREDEISRLSKVITAKDSSLSHLQVAESWNREGNRQLDGTIRSKDQTIKELTRELEDVKKKLDEVVMQRKSEGTALLEVEHFKTDNQRLIKLLSQTEEYKNFGELAADTGLGIRYMNPTPADN